MFDLLFEFLRDSAWGGVSAIVGIVGTIGTFLSLIITIRQSQSNSSATPYSYGPTSPRFWSGIAVIVMIASLISAIISFQSFTAGKSVTATPTPSLPGTLLCQADWSNGLDGWTGSQDWKVLNGQLLNDGSDGSLDPRPTIIAPCQAKETADYRVEVTIKVVRGYVSFDFATVRGTATSNAWTGYKGIVSDGFLQIRTSNNQILTQTVFNPSTIEHTWPDMREAVTKCKVVNFIVGIWPHRLFCCGFSLVI